MSTSQLEIERKYDVDADARVPDLTGAGAIASADAPEAFELDASYFDTPDLLLAQQRVALRRREGGHDAGWHIKWPPAEEGRTEQQFPLTDEDRGTVPEDVLAAVARLVGDTPLVPVARVQNHRIATVLRDASGAGLVELADDHVTTTDLREGVETSGLQRRWQEWEAELLDGAAGTRAERTALLDAVEERLLAAGARHASSGSKLARALGIAR